MQAVDWVVELVAEMPGITSAQIADVLEQWGYSRRMAQRAVNQAIEEGHVEVAAMVHARDPKGRGCMARRLQLVA